MWLVQKEGECGVWLCTTRHALLNFFSNQCGTVPHEIGALPIIHKGEAKDLVLDPCFRIGEQSTSWDSWEGRLGGGVKEGMKRCWALYSGWLPSIRHLRKIILYCLGEIVGGLFYNQNPLPSLAPLLMFTSHASDLSKMPMKTSSSSNDSGCPLWLPASNCKISKSKFGLFVKSIDLSCLLIIWLGLGLGLGFPV